VSPGEAKPSQLAVREIAECFLNEHVDVYLKPSTQYAYRRILEKYIIPEYGNLHFESVTRADVKALRARLFDKSHKFEYVLCDLGSLYTRIIDDWELSDMRNPTSGIKRRPSRRVERFLSPEERRAIVEVIDTGVRRSVGTKGALDQVSAWAIMLLMLTGQWRGEILSLTWEMVDWQHRCLHFPDTTTGQRSTAGTGGRSSRSSASRSFRDDGPGAVYSWLEYFDHSFFGSICAPSYVPPFVEAATVAAELCEGGPG
jgi:integrase